MKRANSSKWMYMRSIADIPKLYDMPSNNKLAKQKGVSL